jgi:general stress protein 26
MEEKSGADAQKKVRELIKDSRIAMLTTRGGDGLLHSRPMATSEAEFDGTLWFLTHRRSHKVEELERDPEVHLSYSREGKENYVSVAGTGQLVTDKATIEKLWSEPARAWFPKGLDDPDLAALKVTVIQAEYWDAPAGSLVLAYSYLKALATGKRGDPDLAEHGVTRYASR